MTYRPRSSVTTILAYFVGRSCVSAMTQTPASGPFGLATVPSIAPVCAQPGITAAAITAATFNILMRPSSDPDAIAGFRKIGDDVPPAIVRHDNLGVLRREVMRFRDDPDTRLRSLRARDRSLDRSRLCPTRNHCCRDHGRNFQHPHAPLL